MAYTNIDDPSAHFQVATYTGAGANQTVTNDGNSDLQPDFLWIKRRNAGYAHALFDSNRGLGSSNPPMLEADSTAAENSNQNWISGVGTDSFTIGINEQNLSNTSGTYVAWQWAANGGTTSSNTDGTITTTVQANTTAGFSILTYTGNGSTGQTIGHGLGVAPDLMIVKNRGGAYNWAVYHANARASNPEDVYGRLNTADGFETATDIFGGSAPTSSVIGVKNFNETNASGANYVAYCFAEKQGYSKFGDYYGTNHADGQFVYTGFKPAFVVLKLAEASTGASWAIFDNKRNDVEGANVIDKEIAANESSAEYDRTNANMDFLSNGFKIRNTDGWHNSVVNYVFFAFAEQPFVTSTGIPTTAR